MWLTDLRLPGKDDTISLCIREGKITAIEPIPHPGEPSITFSSDPVFPGLNNSPDQLDFHLFPALANSRYDNYRAWGRDIHAHNRDEIAAVLNIPQPLRIRWGIYKNLFNGFTTVVNHGEWLEVEQPPITIHQQCNNLHTTRVEPNCRLQQNRHSAAN